MSHSSGSGCEDDKRFHPTVQYHPREAPPPRPATVLISPSGHHRPTVLALLTFPRIPSCFPACLNGQCIDESKFRNDLRSVYDPPTIQTDHCSNADADAPASMLNGYAIPTILQSITLEFSPLRTRINPLIPARTCSTSASDVPIRRLTAAIHRFTILYSPHSWMHTYGCTQCLMWSDMDSFVPLLLVQKY